MLDQRIAFLQWKWPNFPPHKWAEPPLQIFSTSTLGSYKPIKFRGNVTEGENGFWFLKCARSWHCANNTTHQRAHTKQQPQNQKKKKKSNFLNHNSQHVTCRSPGLTNSVGRGSALAPSTTKRYLSTGRYLHPALIVFLGWTQSIFPSLKTFTPRLF